MKLSDIFLVEDAGAGGATGAGGIAGVPTRMTNRAPRLKKGRAPTVKRIKYKNQVVQESTEGDSTNVASIVARLNAAKHRGDTDRPYVTFGLEDQRGNIVRVKVAADQAHEFEQALANTLHDDETDPRDIGEVIYDFKDRFDILGIDWPRDSLEEADDTPDTDNEGSDELDDESPEASDDSTDSGNADIELDDLPPIETTPTEQPQANNELNTTLIAIVDMLKAEIEAKKAEARAREREAEALQAKYASEIAQNKVKAEQDILDMEAWNKKNSLEQKEARKLAMLAKYRYEKSQADKEDRELDSYQMVGRIK